jgi:hypothetical protein
LLLPPPGSRSITLPACVGVKVVTASESAVRETIKNLAGNLFGILLSSYKNCPNYLYSPMLAFLAKARAKKILSTQVNN